MKGLGWIVNSPRSGQNRTLPGNRRSRPSTGGRIGIMAEPVRRRTFRWTRASPMRLGRARSHSHGAIPSTPQPIGAT